MQWAHKRVCCRVSWNLTSEFEFLKIFIYLGAPGLSCCMQDLYLWYVGSSSPTKDRIWAPCIGSSDSEPLDHQASPQTQFLTIQRRSVFSSTWSKRYLARQTFLLRLASSPLCILTDEACLTFGDISAEQPLNVWSKVRPPTAHWGSNRLRSKEQTWI